MDFRFISMIRLPGFVTKEEFDWAVEEASRKKKEGVHIGSYDDEPAPS